MVRDSRSGTSKLAIYQALRTAIISGRRKPGERLSIDDLKNRYGTSVTPVRDALQMLSQEGLVTIKPRSGYFVTRTTLKQLWDLLDLREILEVAAVERAAHRIRAEQIQALRNVHQGYTGDDEQSYIRYTDENRRFHVLVAEASGNQELAAAINRIHERLARFMVIRHAGATLTEIHDLLLNKLESHDLEGSVAAIRDEMEQTRKAIMDRVIQEDAVHWHLGASS